MTLRTSGARSDHILGRTTAGGLGGGAAYGVGLWLLGPLLLMPAKTGMPLFTVDTMALQSLVGHLVFGVVLGAVVVLLSSRSRT